MKTTNLKCMVCDGVIIHHKPTQKLICSKCNAEHASEMFEGKSNIERKFKFHLPKLKFLFAILAAVYLLYLAFRIFS